MKFRSAAEAKKELTGIVDQFEEWIDGANDLGLAPAAIVLLSGESLELRVGALGSKMEVAQLLAAALCHVLNTEELEA